jgi:cell division protein FtsQ
MPRRVSEETVESSSWIGRGWSSSSGFLLPLLGLGVVSLTVLFAWFTFESYLSSSPRFRFRMARMAGEADNLRVRGANRAAKTEIRKLFDDDQGRSLYHMPLAERREQILSIKWVRDAAVIRRWPDGIDVVVEERRPVAFVQLPRQRSQPSGLMLIDAEGHLLPIPEQNDYRLPLLIGLRTDQLPQDRAARVALMKFFLDDVADAGARVAEIDVADPRNLKCRLTVKDRSVLLLLGGENFGANLRRLLAHWDEIEQRMPNATVLDLRVPEHITAAQAPPSADGGDE